MASVRIMFVGQGASLLPEDRFINTFHFHDPANSYATVAGSLRTAVRDFYNTTTSGGNTLASHLSPYMNRAAKVVSYDLEAATPRVPTELTFTLNAAAGGGLPEEVAIVLSLRGAAPVTARRRGRLYIGPLCNNTSGTIENGSNLAPAQPSNGSATHIVQQLVASALALKAASALANCPWSIRSTVPSENFVEITGGWVDNAFDTVRRRGPDSATKDQWGT